MKGETIFALSSGSPPAAIAVVRLSGPACVSALERIAGSAPEPRIARLRTLRDPATGDVLDRALVLFMPGPQSATGEDCAELHLHGGRAVVMAVERTLGAIERLRKAEAGEFTRRAFANGRLDLAEAEGLADLLAAETELQRRNAQALAEGALSHAVNRWLEELLALAAFVEATLDFADEDDVAELPADFTARCATLAEAIGAWLAVPRAETLRDGFRIVIAGPPNAGKSSLFNALVEYEAAIATPIAGTTRDVLSRPVAISGVPFVFTDTAGIRDETDDVIERIGIDRAKAELERADLILWLGPDGGAPAGAWDIETMIDVAERFPKAAPHYRVSSASGEGIGDLRQALVNHARQSMPRAGQVAVSRRQAELLRDARDSLGDIGSHSDPLIVAEHLRIARTAFDRLTGRAAPEDMLDALFGRFCIGK
ncbi:tRNA uridine-5-carboxymethylaminomethyl(34) synthesis GTPase MnmE [Croceicoccus bisphenolivorans]|uniref:tRNA uridine-5-carboxymethylaminomethyl(34) synthesis GTPase MnmE n=1 Tax=Croceicoccus bisphenolivorans TaxID=1783232 RepID=UPI0008328C0E|nr:tRNA uridine-5-carboxymethylaminomethyl(34) synthesis GTPase MnmE [Croceicoccus bisphenolivorans]